MHIQVKVDTETALKEGAWSSPLSIATMHDQPRRNMARYAEVWSDYTPVVILWILE